MPHSEIILEASSEAVEPFRALARILERGQAAPEDVACLLRVLAGHAEREIGAMLQPACAAVEREQAARQ